jgi:outer membrane protein
MSQAFAQGGDPCNQKIGWANSVYILSLMPEVKKVEAELSLQQQQLENQIRLKFEEYQAKAKALKTLPSGTPDAIRNDKEREVALLQENIESFKLEAQDSYQRKTNELMEPIYKKIGVAIDAVAKENGYAYIINMQATTSRDILLFSDEKYNVSILILKKLGVTSTPNIPAKANPIIKN